MASGGSEANAECLMELASTFSMVCAICLYCICSFSHSSWHRLPDVLIVASTSSFSSIHRYNYLYNMLSWMNTMIAICLKFTRDPSQNPRINLFHLRLHRQRHCPDCRDQCHPQPPSLFLPFSYADVPSARRVEMFSSPDLL